ncbi:hypothetical protein BDA99DRAFT_559792 [Phascolomyces articulosus]|uniref:Yeast cell wall synthesis Kre9/Knh1-like N-terminal domain-containing protein n=1 Tax=Phascolomyces articulosus TaxID=60185 RepID=A0AAD5KAL5_9FUNG|nr:hypothetical protein BDA99DRAFT_559792 [Phascolomyces articulosus]
MKFSATAIISAALIAVTSAQGPAPAPAAGGSPIISITSPLSGTSYKAGSKAIISWINPQVQTIPQITLARGPSTALQPVAQIAQNVNAASGRYEWEIPYDCTNGNDYAFELGQSPELAFAGPFTIEGCTGGNFSSAGSNSTSSTPSSSGASAQPSSGSSPAGGSTSSPGGSSSSNGAGSTTDSSHPSSSSSQPGAGNNLIPGFIAFAAGGLVTAYQLF